MKLLLLSFVIVVIIGFGESRIYRYKRSLVLEAACKRFPYLGFCKGEYAARIKDNIDVNKASKSHSSKPSKLKQPSLIPSTSAPQPEQKPIDSKLVPFDTKQFGEMEDVKEGDRLDQQHSQDISNLQQISDESHKSNSKSADAREELVQFDTKQFVAREGVEDFDRIDQMHALMKNQKLERLPHRSMPEKS